jgi:four helix bundle protein
MKAQIRCAALSTMDNVAEGFERGTNREFVQLINYAKGSPGDVRSMIDAAWDQGYLDHTVFDGLTSRAAAVGRLASGLIKYLASSNEPSLPKARSERKT